jgi:BON domain-containing protein
MQIAFRKSDPPSLWSRMRGIRHKETTAERMMNRLAGKGPLAGAAVAGAAAAYLLDPVSGKGRRTRMRSMAAGRVRGAGRRVARMSRGIGSRTYGTAQHLRHLRQEPKDFDDATLAQKVRSEVIGRPGMHADGVNVEAHEGTVVLRGEVEHPQDIKRLSKAVAKLPGVEDVVTYLHLPETPAPNKQGAVR